MNKVIKNIKLNWKWFGDTYMLRGFNIALMNEGGDPSTNDLSSTLAYTTIKSPKQTIEKQTIEKQRTEDSSVNFTYTFYNQMFDESITVVPWIQALYDNSDSAWVSLDGAIIEDDGNATIVVVGNPTFQQIIDMASDSKITPQEKLSLQKEWDEITSDHYATLLGAVKADLDTSHPHLTDYDDKIDILSSYLNYNKEYIFHPIDHEEYTYPSMITDNLTTDLNSGHYGGYSKYKKVFGDFYQAKITLLETIRQAILDNNNEMIQDTIDKSTLPDTIPQGGYSNPEFEINKTINNISALGFIKISSGHFITTTGQKYKIPKATELVTNLNSNKARVKYILFIGADSSRFTFLNEDSSRHFVIATHKNNKWFYICGDNDDMLEFEPIPEDCVVAKIEEHSSVSNGTGIRAIKFIATTQESIFNQLTDNGEQQFIGKDENGLLFINGEYIQAHTIKGNKILANGFKAVSTEDGRTTFEITENGEANIDVKNFTLRAGGKITMQGVVDFESLDSDMQSNFVNDGQKTTINGDSIKTGKITANNNVSEYNLNTGTFRLGGTGLDDYKLYFDGVNLNFGEGAIQWPEMPAPEIPELDDFINHSVSLSKDTMTIKVDRYGTPEVNEVGINGKAVSALTVHRGNIMLTATDEDTERLAKDQFKYVITRTVNCVAKRKNNNEIYIESLENNRAVLSMDGDFGIINSEGYLDANIIEGGYIELDVICGDKHQVFKKAISFSLIKTGEDGQDGQDGVAGEAAKYIKITGDQIFKYDTSGTPLIEEIQLKATTYNFSPTRICWECHDGLNWVQATGINNQLVYEVRHDSEDFRGKDSVRYRCLIDDLFLDEITISKLHDGLDGFDGEDGVAYTAILSNEAHTIACDENGSPLPGELGINGLAKTDVKAYKNTTDLTPIRIVGGDYSSMREGEYCIDIIEQNGCKAELVDADTVYIKEMNSNSAYISINIICEGKSISIKRMSLVKAIKGQPGQDGVDGVGSYVVALSNDYHSIPTDPNGNNGNYTGCETTLTAYYGEDIVEDAVYSAQASQGITGALTKNTYKITNMTTDSGYVDMTATINDKDYTKRFTVTKNKSGENSTAYWLVSSASVIHKNASGKINPTTITFSGKQQSGEESIKDFNCKFRISISTDGSSFVSKYESSQAESTYTYTIPTDAVIVRCQMLMFDTNAIIDEERVPVVSDGEKGEQGPAGPQGPQGPQGPAGTTPTLPDWVEDWTSNSTVINGQSMVSPRIFAGVGGSSATGVALGRQALGTSDTSSTIGLGIYGAGTLIGQIKSIPDSNGIVVEFGTGSTKMTVDKYGNVSAPKMTASEIVSTINGGSTTINGNKIQTGTIDTAQLAAGAVTASKIWAGSVTTDKIATNAITADKIAADSISVNKLSSNNDNPIIKLFPNANGYCSLDATNQFETGGKGTYIRLKWDKYNYWYVGNNTAGVYLGRSDSNAEGREYDSYFWISTTHSRLRPNKLMIGNGNCRIDTTGNAIRLYRTPDGSSDYGLRLNSNCGRLDVNSDSLTITTTGGVTKTVSFTDHTHSNYASSSHTHSNYASSSHTHSNYASSSHKHSGSSWESLSLNKGYINYLYYVNGSTTDWSVLSTAHLSPNTTNRYLGQSGSSRRWQSAFLVSSPNVSSDATLKENIEYLDDTSKTRRRDLLTTNQLHEFIKNDLRLAEYDYIIDTLSLEGCEEEEKELIKSLNNHQIGFIAQDIVDTEVGSKIITKSSDGVLGYETGNFTAVIAGALQEEIRNREELERNCNKLQSKVNELEEIIKNFITN